MHCIIVIPLLLQLQLEIAKMYRFTIHMTVPVHQFVMAYMKTSTHQLMLAESKSDNLVATCNLFCAQNCGF